MDLNYFQLKQVRVEFLPQVGKLLYILVFFTNERYLKRETERWINVVAAVDAALVSCVEKGS